MVVAGILLYLVFGKTAQLSKPTQTQTGATNVINVVDKPDTIQQIGTEDAYFVTPTKNGFLYLSADQSSFKEINSKGDTIKTYTATIPGYVTEVYYSFDKSMALLKMDMNLAPQTDTQQPIIKWSVLTLNSNSLSDIDSVTSAQWLGNTTLITSTVTTQGSSIDIYDTTKRTSQNIYTVEMSLSDIIIPRINARIIYLYGITDEEDIGSLIQFDLQTKKVINTRDDLHFKPIVSENGTIALSTKTDDSLTVIDLAKSSFLKTYSTLRKVENYAVNNDGTLLLVGQNEGTKGITVTLINRANNTDKTFVLNNLGPLTHIGFINNESAYLELNGKIVILTL